MKNIDVLLEKHLSAERDKLIPILQKIQKENGYISEEAVIEVGRYLKLPTSKIYGVATFYDDFRFKPIGKYHVKICKGTACHVLGAQTILDGLKKKLKVEQDLISKDGLFSLEIVPCLGACAIAPIISVNDKFYSQVDIQQLDEIVEHYKNLEE